MKAMQPETSESSRGVAGRRRKSQRHGSRRPRRESRARQTKHETPSSGCIDTIYVILSRAAGTINSIATIDRWLMQFQPLHFTTFFVRLPKRSAFSANCDSHAARAGTSFSSGPLSVIVTDVGFAGVAISRHKTPLKINS